MVRTPEKKGKTKSAKEMTEPLIDKVIFFAGFLEKWASFPH